MTCNHWTKEKSKEMCIDTWKNDKPVLFLGHKYHKVLCAEEYTGEVSCTEYFTILPSSFSLIKHDQKNFPANPNSSLSTISLSLRTRSLILYFSISVLLPTPISLSLQSPSPKLRFPAHHYDRRGTVPPQSDF